MLKANEQSKGNPEWGYKLNFSPAISDILHDFCGKDEIAGAVCPNCDKPLLRLLSLYSEDPLLNFDRNRHPSVHLLYCWTCSIPYGEFSYEINRDGSVKILKVPPRQPGTELGPGGPYDGYTGLFPVRRVALQPLSEAQQQELRARQTEDAPDDIDAYFGHQVGGYPFIYNPRKAFCPKCREEMPVLAAICDSTTGNDDFSDRPGETFTGSGGGVQMVFQFCRVCSVVTAYHSCD
jgi:hypothetical protein